MTGSRSKDMARITKKYNTQYKKKVDVQRDTYLPRLSPGGIIHCAGCGAVYHRRRWTLTLPPGVSSFIPAAAATRRTFCPACIKIRERYPSGEVVLSGATENDKREVFRILRNEEWRAKEKNPLERIISVEAHNGGWKVATTTEKLAQRLGRCLRKARGGKLVYKWGHNNKFVRVFWEKVP
jgi:hypothetical protein